MSEKSIKRTSYRFDSEIFSKFKKYCEKEGYKQVKLLEKMMVQEMQKNEKGNKGNKGNNDE